MKFPVFNYELQKWEDSKSLLLTQLNSDLTFYSSQQAIEVGAIDLEEQPQVIQNIKLRITEVTNLI